MKIIVKYISVLVLILSFASCEQESNFQDPDVVLVPIYSITDIQGSGSPFKINIYREKSLIIEYISQVNPLSFESSNYSDSSTGTDYQISVNKIDDNTSVNYIISADKATGIGTMTVDSGTVYDITISEDSVYN